MKYQHAEHIFAGAVYLLLLPLQGLRLLECRPALLSHLDWEGAPDR